MARPLSTTEILQAIIMPFQAHPLLDEKDLVPEIEQEAQWFPAEDASDPSDGMAMAQLLIGEKRYSISLEKLP